MVTQSLGIRKFFGSSLELFHIFGAKILYKFEDIFAILKSGIVDQGDNNVPFWTGAILGQANVETWPLVLSMRCQYLSNCDHSCKAVWRPKKLNHFQKLRKTIIEQPRRQRSANLWLCQATPCWWGDVTTRSQHEVPIFVEWRPFLHQGSLTTKKAKSFSKIEQNSNGTTKEATKCQLRFCQATPCWFGDVTTRSQHEVPTLVQWRPFLQGSLTTKKAKSFSKIEQNSNWTTKEGAKCQSAVMSSYPVLMGRCDHSFSAWGANTRQMATILACQFESHSLLQLHETGKDEWLAVRLWLSSSILLRKITWHFCRRFYSSLRSNRSATPNYFNTGRYKAGSIDLQRPMMQFWRLFLYRSLAIASM